jgi:hypothetical protein
METRDILADAYGRIQEAVHRVAAELDGDDLLYRPDPSASSIA